MRREDFPILNSRDMAYLDNGATTQKPQKVLDAVNNFYEHENANPHRGAYSLSIEATEAYENTRVKMSESRCISITLFPGKCEKKKKPPKCRCPHF